MGLVIVVEEDNTTAGKIKPCTIKRQERQFFCCVPGYGRTLVGESPIRGMEVLTVNQEQGCPSRLPFRVVVRQTGILHSGI